MGRVKFLFVYYTLLECKDICNYSSQSFLKAVAFRWRISCTCSMKRDRFQSRSSDFKNLKLVDL